MWIMSATWSFLEGGQIHLGFLDSRVLLGLVCLSSTLAMNFFLLLFLVFFAPLLLFVGPYRFIIEKRNRNHGLLTLPQLG